MIRHVFVVASLAALVSNALAADAVKPMPVAPNTVVRWEDGIAHAYTSGNLTISLKSKVSKGHPADAVLTIAMAKGPAITFPFSGGFDGPAGQFAVGRLDPKDPALEVLFASYTGGAHCCLERKVFVVKAGKWKMLSINFGMNEGELDWPTDANKDGAPDFVLADDNFAYQFGCFACSWLPPRVLVVRGGALVDASASRKYDAVYRDDLEAAKKACIGEDKDRGFCAGVAADGARLGAFEENWRWLLKNYPRDDNGWEYPDGCKVTTRAGQDCPDDDVIKYTGYPEALAAFLKRYGYITQGQMNWAAAEAKK